ncbi:Ribosomal L1 domain-containing protein 1 [Triticum urartu]|uniref:Ribosomal L1 domain-containing protein 1 n=1 Tax=Triticum urartu TaxID=4572 RepID=M8A276_TRIUA|nr:Ribosomal L1 domain-containing protein 1 [Triticum urartu]
MDLPLKTIATLVKICHSCQPPTHPRRHGPQATASLPIPDELLAQIFLHLPTPTDLLRASAACVSFRRVVADRSFLRQYRKLHAPPLLGFLSTNTGFHPAEPPHPSASVAGAVALAADFTFSFVPSPAPTTCWFIQDIRDGRVLLGPRGYFCGAMAPVLSATLRMSRGLLLPPRAARRRIRGGRWPFLLRLFRASLLLVGGDGLWRLRSPMLAGSGFLVVGASSVRKVLSSTFLYLRTGTCSGIKVGRLDMEEEEIVDNVMAAVEAAVEKVPKKWENVRALHLKAVDSVALPIYQVVPELGMKIEAPVARLEAGVGAGEVIDAAEVGTGSKRKDKKMKALKDANGGAEGLKYKRKRNKKDQTEDAVMEEAPEATEKRRKKESVEELSAGEDLKTPKKGKDKKRALDKEVEDDASPAEKKGKKSEHASKEASNKKSKDKQAPKEVEDVGSKKNKGKKKKSLKGDSDDGEILFDGESTPAALIADKEEKKSRGKKSSGDKMKRSRARV